MGKFKSNIISNFFVQVFNLGLGFIVSIFVTRQLGELGKGYLSFFMLISDMIVSYGHLGVMNAVNYFQTRKGYEEENIFRNNMTYFSLVWIVFSIGLSLLYFGNIALVEYSKPLFILLIIYILLLMIKTFLNNLYIGSEKILEMNKFYIISTITSTILVLVMLHKINITIYIGIKTIEILVNVILLIKNIGYKYKPKLELSLIKSEIKFGINPLISTLCIYLNYRIDQFFIKSFNGLHELGIYALAVSLVELVLIIPQTVANPITAKLYNIPLDSPARRGLTMKTLRYGFTLCVIISALGILCIPLIPIVYTKAFAPSMKVAFILFLSIPFVSISKITTPYFYSSGNTKVITRFSFTALVINIVLLFILTPKFGAIGAAYSSSISYLIYGVQYILYFKKEFNTKARNLLFIRYKEGKDLVISSVLMIKGRIRRG